MTKSEKITSMISENFFLPQYIYTDIYVKEGKLEKEFCDCLIEFSSVYIAIQIKERKLNVSQNTIAKIESGLRRPSIDFLLEISEFFNVSTNYLVFGVHAEDVEDEKLKKDIDEAIKKIDQTIIQYIMPISSTFFQKQKQLALIYM